MLGNSTASRRMKEKGSVNGIQKSAQRRTANETMEYSSSHIHNISNLDAEQLTLWKHPIITLHYFFSEVFINILSLARKTLLYKKTVCAIISIVTVFLLSSRISGPQQQVCQTLYLSCTSYLYKISFLILNVNLNFFDLTDL